MIDLSTLPLRLPSIKTCQGPVAVERLQRQHALALAEAGKIAAESVHPWMGKTLCPITLRNAQQSITQIEQGRQQGFGIAYTLMHNTSCLGMGVINYIHPVHKNANLGFWLVPNARGQGLATALCHSLLTLAFNQIDVTRAELFIEPTNHPSIKLAERLHAHREGLCKKRIFGRDALLFSITN